MVHNQTSSCQVNRFKLKGRLLKVINTNVYNVRVRDGFNNILLQNPLEVQQIKTPIVEQISSKIGGCAGGYNITFTGSNLGFGTAKIYIDTV